MGINQEPLTESYFYILLCLYQKPRHGYGIMQEAARLSNGNVKIGSGTMYGAVSNMLKKGWIVETASDDPNDSRKRLYQLTDEGRNILQAEITRLQHLLSSAEQVMEISLKNPCTEELFGGEFAHGTN